MFARVCYTSPHLRSYEVRSLVRAHIKRYDCIASFKTMEGGVSFLFVVCLFGEALGSCFDFQSVLLVWQIQRCLHCCVDRAASRVDMIGSRVII